MTPAIRHLQERDMAQVRSVWQTCFGDSDGFLDAYFAYAADVRNGLGLFEGEKLLSDLFVLDFRAVLSGASYPTPFLAGCATLPRARKKDFMRTLVRHALREMKARGVAVTFLHPFLHNFYRKFGYETVAYVTKHTLETDRPRTEPRVEIAETVRSMPTGPAKQAYDAYVSRFDSYFARTPTRMETWLRLLFADGGKAAFIPGATPTPYALYFEREETAEIFELVCFNDAQREALLRAAGQKRCEYFLPALPGDPNGEEFTMMRTLDPVSVLARYPFSEDVDFSVSIEDAFLEREYRLRVNVKNGVAAVTETEGPCELATDVAVFSRMVSGVCGLAQIRSLFPKKSACYFETY